MKYYKALRLDERGKLYSDLSGKRFYYEIGKEYKENKIALSKKGFHACEKLSDVFNYYVGLNKWTKYAEVKLGEKILKSINDSLVCSNSIIVKKILSKEKIIDIIKKENCDLQNKAIEDSVAFKSKSVGDSNFISYLYGIYFSFNIADSRAVSGGKNIKDSQGIYSCNVVRDGIGIAGSDCIEKSTCVANSSYVSDSKAVYFSVSVGKCWAVYDSRNIFESNVISNSQFITKCNNLSNCLFCYDINLKENHLFNKEVSAGRIAKVKQKIRTLIKGEWKISFNNMLELHDKYKSDIPLLAVKDKTLKEAYKKFPKELLKYLKSLPEFDSKIFNKIIGR